MQTMHQCSVRTSCIVPCHDVEEWISPLIKSLNEQTAKDFEIIFVLDDCKDNTEKVIRDECTKDYKIYHCNVHSCGTARNKGLDIAQGKYIWFLDADDWILHEQAIETLSNTLDVRDDVDVIQFRYKSQGFNMYCNQMVWQYFYRRSIIGDTRFRAQMPTEDGVFQEAVLTKATRMIVDVPLYYYNYPREGSVMERHKRGMDVNEGQPDA